MKISCPACGAEVEFRSRASVFGVCSFCNSSIVRTDMNVETIGKMSEMPQDMSPLQLGVRGKFQNKSFEIVGRQKIGWAQGTWNEWYVLFDDGRDGWLADAQGFYMLSFQIREGLGPLPAAKDVKVGGLVTLQDKTFSVDDQREVVCSASEGELSVRSPQGRRSLSVDLKGPGNEFANIDYPIEKSDPQDIRVFIGAYGDFEDFKFTNLREFDGW